MGRGSAAQAKLFVHELARKPGHVVYNLLPDLLSRMSGDPAVSPEAFQRVMTLLLSFVDKERQAESLLERLTGAARSLARSLAQSRRGRWGRWETGRLG